MQKREKAEPAFFSVNTLAERWAVSPQFVWKLIYADQLKAGRFGNRRRVSASEAERFEREALKRGQAA